jgi:predicted nucleic acid-binding protein
MIVVTNASPLAALSFIHQIDLLHDLYGTVMVPDAVWHEVMVAGIDRPGRDAVARADWIQRCSVGNHQLVTALLQDLDEGEAEAITLAAEKDADLLIIDERLGRRAARRFGLEIIGVIGVLIEAKHRGLLSKVRPYLDQLRYVAGFRISDALYLRVLEDEGES